jgi:hypothetical protein
MSKIITVNELRFNIYDLDTNETVRNRIAVSMNTLPKYLYFENSLDINSNTEITVENIIDIIDNLTDTKFIDFYEEIKHKLNDNITKIELLYLYIKFYVEKTHVPHEYKKILYSEQYGIIDDLYDNYKEYLNESTIDIDKLIKDFNRKIKIEEEHLKNFDSLQTVNYTEFELSKSVFHLSLESTDNITILELFNNIVLNEYCPIAGITDYVKILKTFTINKNFEDEEKKKEWISNWFIVYPNYISLKILQTMYLEDTSTYILATIEVKNNKINAKFKYQSNINYVNQDELIRRFLSVFSTTMTFKSERIKEDKNVNGIFYIPKNDLNKYIFSDLIANSSLFASVMYVDESINASTLRNNIFIHFENSMLGKITLNLLGKVMFQKDPSMKYKLKNQDVFPDQIGYIRIKIKNAESITKVEQFQNIFSKFFRIYLTEKVNIYNYYVAYIPDFPVNNTNTNDVIIDKEEKVTLRKLAPDLFLTNYGRVNNCQLTKISGLEIIRDDEVDDYKEQDYTIMRYPKDEIGNVKNYICTDKRYKYPGVTLNKLQENKEKYPYVPCCFIKNQLNSAKYKKYFEDEDIIEKKQNNIIKTNKFVTDTFGYLPDNMNRYFNTIEEDPVNYEYLRLGVKNDKNSILRCILKCLSYVNPDELNSDTLNDIVIEKNGNLDTIRQELSFSAVLCRQELYDDSVNEIIEQIRDVDNVLDVTKYINVIENRYKCNIYIFTRNEENEYGSLTLPNHKKSYIKQDNNYRSIFVYQHNGSESNNSLYTRCEIIIRIKRNRLTIEDRQDYKSIFEYNNPTTIKVRNTFNRLKYSYNLISDIYDYILPDLTYIRQKLDSYGKVRILTILYKNKEINLITKPIQPINTPENTSKIIKLTKYNLAMDFIKTNGFTIKSKTVYNKKLREISFEVGINLIFTIQLELSNINIDSIKINVKNELSYPITTEESKLEIFNNYKKLAGYISEYTLWLFSRYIYTNNISEITNDTILSFSDIHIQVISDFEYIGNVKKYFSTEDNTFIVNSENIPKIIINTESFKLKLIYFIKLQLSRFYNNVINYHNRSAIENYYVNISDFTKYKYQVILKGNNVLDSWYDNNNNKITYYIYKNIITKDNIKTYYFRNNYFENNKTFIAQHSYILDKALSICIIWNNKGYNSGNNVYSYEYTHNTPDYSLYLINKSNNMLELNNNIVSENKIVKYTINDIDFYVSLLTV